MSYSVNRIGLVIENNRREVLLIKDNTSDKLKFPFTSVIKKYRDDSWNNEIYTIYYLLSEKMGVNIDSIHSLLYRKRMRLRPHHMFYSLYHMTDDGVEGNDELDNIDKHNTLYNISNNITNNTKYIISDLTEKHKNGVITKYNYECNYQYFWMNENDIIKNIDNMNIDVRGWIKRDDKYVEGDKK